MASDIVFTAIRDFLTANWTTCPLIWENETFVPPAPDVNGNLAPWITTEVFGNVLDQISIGAGTPAANLWREEGVALFYIFTQSGTGSLVARQLATQLAELLKGLLLLNGDLTFRDMSIGGSIAGTDDGNFWGLLLRTSWCRDNHPD